MKFLFILMSSLLLNVAQAEVQGCAGYYASKLEDVFSGVAPLYANQEILEFGTHVKDDFFQVYVDDLKDSFKVDVTTHTSDIPLELEITPLHPMVTFFSTENLKGRYKYPANIPGEELGAVYLTFMCVR